MRRMKIKRLFKEVSIVIGVWMVAAGGTTAAAAPEENISLLEAFASNLRVAAEQGDR